MTLRTRLFLLVGGVVAATVALVTWTVSVNARNAFEAFDRQRTTALMAELRREVGRQGDDVTRRVDRLVASDIFQRLAAEIVRRPGEFGPFVNEADALASAQGLDFLDLVADDGTLISSAEWPARFGYRFQADAVAAKTPAAFLQAVALPHEVALGLMAARTVTPAGRPLHLIAGRRLDRQFLQGLSLPAGMRALLYRSPDPAVAGQPLNQLLIGASGPVAPAAPLEPLIARVRQTGQEANATVAWPDGSETVDAMPLTGAGGTVLGVLLLGSSNRAIESLLTRIRWTGFAFGALGVALGLALGYILARRITRPIEQLAGAANEVAGGRWDVRTDDVHAAGEIGALARAFDTMTRQLVDHRERLVQAERVAAWRELARRLAHELKNPLFPLRLTIDNLRRAKPLPAPEFDEVFTESLDTMAAGLANLNTVVGRFSDFARMPAPVIAPVAPNAIVDDAVRLFRAQIAAPGRPPVRVTVDLDPSASTIQADREQIARAVQNLLLNAIDAMPQGGALGIRTHQEADVFTIEISDTGEGLTEEECRRLFTPYYTTKQHGTGLGLAIVQSVVSDHGGKVWVDSTRGRGTTFHVALPIAGKAVPA